MRINSFSLSPDKRLILRYLFICSFCAAKLLMPRHKSNGPIVLQNEKRCLKYLCANNADQMRGLLSCFAASGGSVPPSRPPNQLHPRLLHIRYICMIIWERSRGKKGKVERNLGKKSDKWTHQTSPKKKKQHVAVKCVRVRNITLYSIIRQRERSPSG